MKKPVVDYREFRLSRLREPRFSHLWLLAGWIGYFILYFLTENLIPAEACHPMHCWLDDHIPFNEWFVIPYVGWYLLCFGSLLYYGLYNIPNFRRLQTYIIITQAVAMTAYILYPSRQDLRPAVFPRENLLTAAIGALYAFDTSTGVCPSLHVAYSLGILSVFAKDREVPRWWKLLLTGLVLLISMATAFIKQHSVLDILAALPVGLLAEGIVFRDYWRARLRRSAPGRQRSAGAGGKNAREKKSVPRKGAKPGVSRSG